MQSPASPGQTDHLYVRLSQTVPFSPPLRRGRFSAGARFAKSEGRRRRGCRGTGSPVCSVLNRCRGSELRWTEITRCTFSFCDSDPRRRNRLLCLWFVSRSGAARRGLSSEGFARRRAAAAAGQASAPRLAPAGAARLRAGQGRVFPQQWCGWGQRCRGTVLCPLRGQQPRTHPSHPGEQG